MTTRRRSNPSTVSGSTADEAAGEAAGEVAGEAAGEGAALSVSRANNAPSRVAKALQSINVVGISSYLSLLSTFASLKLGASPPSRGERAARIPILPTVDTPDIRNIDWAQLYADHNIRGVLFDKDHTLTLPYAHQLHPYAAESLRKAKEVFGERNVVLYSNSAGLRQYDPEGREAALLERELGVRVLRHKYKKPFVSDEVREEVEAWFGVAASRLAMVGDRYMTDVVFGNRLGMMSIRVKPFVECRDGGVRVDDGTKRVGRDPKSVRVSRKFEEALVRGFRDVLGDETR